MYGLMVYFSTNHKVVSSYWYNAIAIYAPAIVYKLEIMAVRNPLCNPSITSLVIFIFLRILLIT